jgi:hypothetical protein
MTTATTKTRRQQGFILGDHATWMPNGRDGSAIPVIVRRAHYCERTDTWSYDVADWNGRPLAEHVAGRELHA